MFPTVHTDRQMKNTQRVSEHEGGMMCFLRNREKTLPATRSETTEKYTLKISQPLKNFTKTKRITKGPECQGYRRFYPSRGLSGSLETQCGSDSKGNVQREGRVGPAEPRGIRGRDGEEEKEREGSEGWQ